MLVINQIKLDIDEDLSNLKIKIAKRLNVDKKEIKSFKIIKRSLDSRKKPIYIYNLEVEINNEQKYLKIKDVFLKKDDDTIVKKVNSNIRPIIIGLGPAGLFSAYRLIEAGLKPIVFEQGKQIKERKKDVDLLFNEGILNESSNVVFGQGGAGTFSDAKLTTRIKSPFIKYICDVFIKYGAPKEIAYVSHPHIGTDIIQKVIENMCNDMESKGLEIHYEEKVIDFDYKDNHINEIITNKAKYDSDLVILACGHSGLDIFKMVKDRGIYLEQKDIAVGFRVEHPQEFINKNQRNGSTSKLEASEYFLRYKDDLGVYSFCMCPGGYVVPSMNEKETIVTNGMSYHSRDNILSNSAILIQVPKEEFNSDDPLAGFYYLNNIERKAYQLSNSFKAPAMNIKDYVNNELNPLIFKSSYCLDTNLYNINELFTTKQNEIFKKAFKHFDTLIPGFINEGIIVAPETKSSSPVRVLRDIDLKSINCDNLYPTGEGCGYGGGIMSCSVDGIRIADKIISSLL